jgi:hypothetical protein
MSEKDHWGRIMRFRSFLSTVALAASVVGAGSANAAVIINGDFEAIQIGGPDFRSSNTADIPGWTHGGTAGDALLWNKGFNDGFASAHAGSGNQFVTMGGGFTTSDTSSWTTTITGLNSGQTYRLTFMIAYEANFNQFNVCGEAVNSCTPIIPIPQTVTVAMAGGGSGSFTTGTANTPYWGTWENENLLFVASGPSENATFAASTQFDVGLDNVQISAVPELSTWGMMLLGFAGIGLVGYRRKTNAALAA